MPIIGNSFYLGDYNLKFNCTLRRLIAKHEPTNPPYDYVQLPLHLEELDLSNTNVSIMHPDIRFLMNIKIFKMNYNLLNEDSNLHVTCGIPKLEELYLRGNYFKIIPDWIACLKKLKLLDFSKNEIEEVPNFVFEMPNLEVLILEDTKIDDVVLNQLRKKYKGKIRIVF